MIDRGEGHKSKQKERRLADATRRGAELPGSCGGKRNQRNTKLCPLQGREGRTRHEARIYGDHVAQPPPD